MYKKIDSKILCGKKFKTVILNSLTSKESVIVSFVNPFSYMELVRQRDLIDDIDYLFSDGSMLCKFHQFFFKKIERASFDYSSIADFFFKILIEQHKSIAIIGAKDDEVFGAATRIQNRFPTLDINYVRNGYVKGSEDKILSELNAIKPDVVLLGMGSPYQEIFSKHLKEKLSSPNLIITCGGFLTQTSIKDDYYHPIIKKLGLRWLQRIVLHSHVRERVLKEYPKFTIKYLRAHLRKSKEF